MQYGLTCCSGDGMKRVLGSGGFWTRWLILLTCSLLIHHTSSQEVKQYCQWDVFNATCGYGQVILMASAHYGRMTRGHCLTTDNVGCSADVLRMVDGRCSGRQSCVIEIPDADLFQVQPCRKDLVAYFEAAYSCVPVSPMAGGTNADGLGQQIPGCHSRRMYGPSGYLASSTTQRYGVGGLKCPWEVSLQPGQRVTLHLYDYTEHTTRQRHHPGFSNSPNSQQPKCPIYAMVMDDTHLEYIRVCGNERRGQKVYTSTSNYVHITVVNVSEQLHQRNFMLKYQATGCPDPAPQEYSLMTRLGETLVVKCNYTDETWHLVCKGTEWIGQIHNCTKGSDLLQQEAQRGTDAFPFGLMLAIAVGVIIGVLLGFVFLILAFVCRRSIRQRTVPREAASGALLFDHPIENDPNNTYKLVEVRHQDIQEAPEVTQNIQNTAELGVRMMAARDYEKPVRSQTLDILKGTPQCACAVEESAGVSTVAVEEGHYSVDNWHPEDVYRTRSEIYPASFASVGPSRRQRPCPKAQEQHKSSVPNLSVSTELHYFT